VSKFVRKQAYNGGVSASSTKAQNREHPKHHAYALETTGLLLIAVLLLILTVVRYWAYISWNAR
jgi:hypothetical protein